jgi:hypothetical protein
MQLQATHAPLGCRNSLINRQAKLRLVIRSSAVSTSIKQPCSVSLENLGRGEGQTFPLNTYGGKKAPFIGKVVLIERLGGRDKERDVSHIVIDTGAHCCCASAVRHDTSQSTACLPVWVDRSFSNSTAQQQLQ